MFSLNESKEVKRGNKSKMPYQFWLGIDQSEVTVPAKLKDMQNRTKGKFEKHLKLKKLLRTNTLNTISLIQIFQM